MIEIVDRFQIQTKIKVFYYYDYRAQTNWARCDLTFGRDYIARKYDSIDDCVYCHHISGKKKL